MRAMPLAMLVLLALAVPVGAAPPDGRGADRVAERHYDQEGRLLWERGFRTDSDVIAFERFYRHVDSKARPGGGGGGGGGGVADPGTDCEPDNYRKAPWKW